MPCSIFVLYDIRETRPGRFIAEAGVRIRKDGGFQLSSLELAVRLLEKYFS